MKPAMRKTVSRNDRFLLSTQGGLVWIIFLAVIALQSDLMKTGIKRRYC
mgnify:CR=1 FL=1